MKKHLINFLVFLLFWAVGYYLGDGNIDSYKDYISMSSYILGLMYLIWRYVV